MTIDQIKSLFSSTIFWNYGLDWPGDVYKDPEDALEVVECTPDEDGNRKVVLQWAGGELTVNVAKMWPANDTQDPEGHTTDADVEFVAKLPVIIPALLREIDRLKGLAASAGAALIADERRRQIEIEGYTPEHDYQHSLGELSGGGASYARTASLQLAGQPLSVAGGIGLQTSWAWRVKDWKPSADPVRNLVKAGALIAAEIDRLQGAYLAAGEVDHVAR